MRTCIARINMTKLVWICVAIFTFSCSTYFNKWKNKEIIINDTTSYYSYLPAVFIHQDLSISFGYKTGTSIWVSEDELGHKYLRMTSGCAMMWAPFFLALYGGEIMFTDHTPHGYEVQYHFIIAFAAIFYLLFGLVLIQKLLQQWFSRWISIGVALSVYLCSNLFYYVHIAPGMSHVYSFFLTAAFIWLWYYKHAYSRKKQLALLGLVAGLVVLIRPTNIVLLVIPALTDLIRYKFNLRFISKRLSLSAVDIVLFVLTAFLVIFPQLLYWKITTGSWITYTYGEEGFYWSDPKILKGLFSWRKGWFVYSPFFILAFLGAAMSWYKWKYYHVSLLLVFALFAYITFSWWCWWYGGGFGTRPFVELYPFLALPLAGFFKKAPRVVIFILLTGFFMQNIVSSDLANTGIVHYDAMSKEAWKKIYTGHWDLDWSDYKYPDYDGAKFYNLEISLVNSAPRYTNRVSRDTPLSKETISHKMPHTYTTCVQYLNSVKYIGSDTLKLVITATDKNTGVLLRWEDTQITLDHSRLDEWITVRTALDLEGDIADKPVIRSFIYKENNAVTPFIEGCKCNSEEQ